MGRQQGRTASTGRQQQTRSSYTNRAYIEGNTVRKLNTVPERTPQEKREREQRRRVERATRANRERALRMGPGYLLFLTLAIAMTVGICALYVHLQSDINGRMRNIATLESQILNLKTDNDAALKRVETSVDMDEVKNKAINEMHMVYPDEEQIVYFEINTGDYMNQYQDIPED